MPVPTAKSRHSKGFTLLELMIALAILAILAVFALPAYQSSIDTAEDGVVRTNMETIELFQEDYRLRRGIYAIDLADIAAINAEIGWDPQSNDGITYLVRNTGDGSAFYDFEATHPDGWTVCTRFPDKDPCP